MRPQSSQIVYARMHVVANFRLPSLYEWLFCREFSNVKTFLKVVRHETHDTKQVA